MAGTQLGQNFHFNSLDYGEVGSDLDVVSDISSNQVRWDNPQGDFTPSSFVGGATQTAQSFLFPPVLDVTIPPGDLDIEDDSLNSIPIDPFPPAYQGHDTGDLYLPGYSEPRTGSAAQQHFLNQFRDVGSLNFNGRQTNAVSMPYLRAPEEVTQSPFETGQMHNEFIKTLTPYRGPSRPRNFSFPSETASTTASTTDASVASAPPLNTNSPPELIWGHRSGQHLSIPVMANAFQRPASAHSSYTSLVPPQSRRKEQNQCSKCNKRIIGRDGMRRHLATHEENKEARYRAQCEICGRRWPTHKDRKRHQRTHSNTRNLQCGFPGCGSLFKGRLDNARRHVVNQHHIDSSLADSYIRPAPTT